MTKPPQALANPRRQNERSYENMSDTIIDAWNTIVKCEPMKADKIAPVSGLEPLTRRDVALLRLAAILLQKGKEPGYDPELANDNKIIVEEILEPVLQKALQIEVTESELADALGDIGRCSDIWTAFHIIS